MDLYERVVFLIIGGAVGFILGYIVARLREIKEEVDEVLSYEKRDHEGIDDENRGERGAVRLPSFGTVALILVLSLTVWASFQTARVNSELDRTLRCLTEYNTSLGEALRGRDDAIQSGTQSEIDLWTLYEDLYVEAQEVKEDPVQLEKLQMELNKAIVKYRDDLIVLQKARQVRPYPEPDIAAECEE